MNKNTSLNTENRVVKFILARYPKAFLLDSFKYRGVLEVQFYPHPDALNVYCALVHPNGHIEILTEF